MGRRAVTSTVLPLILAVMLVLGSSVQVALAGSASGNLTCSPERYVRIWSRAGSELWHLWTLHGQYWWNPNKFLRESFTGYNSTWWTVSWSVSSDGQGATCFSL
jgi:hypothetical protein